MKCLDKNKILEFMGKREASLYKQLTQDFSGGIWERVPEHREVKYWKEAIERGEFDTELQEVFVILSADMPEIVDFTYFTERIEVEKRVEQLNKLAKRRKYWYITMYSNFRNSGDLHKNDYSDTQMD